MRIDRSEFWFCFFEGMRVLEPFLWPVFVLAVVLAFTGRAGASPCLPDAAAVRKAHPGVHVWADWHLIDGHKCWMAKGEWDGRHVSAAGPNVRAADGDGSRRRRVSDLLRKQAEVIPLPRERPPSPLTPISVPTVTAVWHDTLTETDRAIETTGAAAPHAITLAWPDQFAALQERPFIPAVLTITEPKPETTVVSLRAPSRLRSDWRTDLIHFVAGVLAFVCVLGVGTYVVAKIDEWLRARAGRIAEARR